MIIGITGSIGSGKTTVAKIFGRHGFKVIDADEIGHKFLKKGTVQYAKLVKYFGKDILDAGNEINRSKLADAAFSEKKKYRALNSIMLQPIANEIKKILKESPHENFAIDAPLLLESGAKDLDEFVVVVKSSWNNIFMRNKKFSKKRIIQIKRYQKPISTKLKHANYVINNDGSIKSLDSQVANVIKAISKKYKSTDTVLF
ncbi:dephospho-CoA kinase [Candidatus Woesearchaeota archaeon]|nr:dephospho-CoA kinase [Candidatus Woesearchaeota archaeon]